MGFDSLLAKLVPKQSPIPNIIRTFYLKIDFGGSQLVGYLSHAVGRRFESALPDLSGSSSVG